MQEIQMICLRFLRVGAGAQGRGELERPGPAPFPPSQFLSMVPCASHYPTGLIQVGPSTLPPQGPPKDGIQAFRVRLCQELSCGQQPLTCPQ